MAWASTDIIPTNVSLNVVASLTAGILDGVKVKIAPLNSANTKFDCSAATHFTITAGAPNGVPYPVGAPGSSGAIVPSAADATGLTMTLSAADVVTLVTGMQALTIPITVTATDGTTVLIMGTGNVSVKAAP